MSNIFFGIITLSIAATACVFVYVLIEVRGAVKAIKEFLKTTEDSLNPTLEELRKSLKSIRNVTDNTTAITEDVRTLSASVREVGKDIMHVSKFVSDATSVPFFCISGLRAGIKAAIGVIVKDVISSKKAKA
jgi:uncharacterized protein YoxC